MEEGFDDGFEEGEEEGVLVGIGGNDAIDLERKGIGMRNERVETLGNGSATDQSFDIGNRVEDQKNEGIGKRIKAVIVVVD